MKKVLISLICFIFLFSSVVYGKMLVSIDDYIEINTDGTRIDGEIVPIGETQSQEINEVKVYTFNIDNYTSLDLHFVSHVPTMQIILKDENENTLLAEWPKSEEPTDKNFIVLPGRYTFHINKQAPIGFAGATFEDNIGKYWFYFDATNLECDFPITPDKENDPFSINIDQEYNDVFSTLETKDQIKASNHNFQFNIWDEQTYATIVSNKKIENLDFVIKDVNENIIEDNYDSNSKKRLYTLPKGKYSLIVKSTQSGFYTFKLNTKNESVLNKIDQNEDSTPSIMSEKKNTEIKNESNIFIQFYNKVLLPFCDKVLLPLFIAIAGGIYIYHYSRNRDSKR